MGRVAPRRRRGGRRRSADEAARRTDAGARRERRHRRTVLDPPRPELRYRLRSLRQPDGDRDRRDRSRGRRDARVLRAVRPASPRASRRARPRARREHRESHRPRAARDTSRTSSISSRGRRSTSQTPSSSSASRSSSARSFSPIGRTACTDRAVATLRFSVAETLAGSRLDRALAERDEIGTRSLAERLVREGAVTVDGAERDKSHRLAAGSVVEVRLPEERSGALRPEPVTVGLAYEDEHLLVVDKPAGMTVHPGAGTLQRHARGTTARARCGGRATIPTGRGSSTASIARRPGCSSSRAPRRRTPRSRRRSGHGRSNGGISRSSVADRARAAGGSTPRSAATGAIRPGGRSTRTSRARPSRWFETRELMAEHAFLEVRARDRPHAPDPRPPRRDRAPGCRGPGVRRER